MSDVAPHAEADQFTPGDEPVTAEKRLNELRLSLSPEINYRLSTIFPKVEGFGWRGNFKAKHKLLKKVEPTLLDARIEGEEICYVAKGAQYSLLEQYFMGIWAAHVNQTVFVLTNARLLLMRCDAKGKPKKTFWMIYYSQIEQLKSSWNGVVVLKLKDGKKLKFTGFPKKDRQEMPRIFEELLETYRERNFDPEVTQSRENLCSACFTVVPLGEYDCERCGATFWPPKQLALRSLVFPSWGDWLMGHHLLGFFELIGMAMTWFIAVGLITVAINEADGGAALVALFMIITLHGVDAALTYSLANKGLHPKRLPKPETETESIFSS
ncbi:hypothetical protein [Stratiformator vulcanicus]|uniref:YokE-like PH domain-containing protein n=1 Tax=Stratiformator vulcanicus TaxID=2527980 RepID=A0A517QXY2_9PLAN|nr:hypothetical protein [Stratiformator vulcanicus]QDT36463.1 hypothetical protein Pan189_08200 [Stratiformator vulcanicus]